MGEAMTEPEALRLADAIDSDFDPDWMHEEGYDQIAAELRRLHEVNAELVEALWELVKWYGARDDDDVLLPDRNQNPEIYQAIQALAKAQGDNNANE